MTKLKTSELTGKPLNWAVAKAVFGTSPEQVPEEHCGYWYAGFGDGGVSEYSPSTDWSQGGPLIEKYDVNLEDAPWSAYCEGQTMMAIGESPLSAVCRAVVAAKLGDEVDVPEELV